MRIGIDIDDTICNTRDSIKKKFKELKIDYQIFNNLSFEEKENIFSTYALDVLSTAKLLKNVKETIDYLKKEGNIIYIITARNTCYDDRIPSMTIDYLEKNNIYYDEIIFDAKTKGEACLKNNIDIMIDDNYENCMCVKNSNIDVLYYNNDNVVTNEIRCVYNWKNIYDYFKEELWKNQ